MGKRLMIASIVLLTTAPVYAGFWSKADHIARLSSKDYGHQQNTHDIFEMKQDIKKLQGAVVELQTKFSTDLTELKTTVQGLKEQLAAPSMPVVEIEQIPEQAPEQTTEAA